MGAGAGKPAVDARALSRDFKTADMACSWVNLRLRILLQFAALFAAYSPFGRTPTGQALIWRKKRKQ
jgi:hypothetical protein